MPATTVVPLPGQISNAFLLRGDRPVLVDAGAPGEVHSLLAQLRDLGVAPTDLALAVMTHGHVDHVGAAHVLADAGVPVMVGAADAHLMAAGRIDHLPVTGPGGAALRPFIRRMRARTVTPALLIQEPTSLERYGVSATVLPVAGHTPGSCVVVLPGGDAIVGDLVRGGFLGGRVCPRHPLRHYFAEDPDGVRRGLEQVLARDPAQLFVGHGGPSLTAEAVRRRLDAVAPPT